MVGAPRRDEFVLLLEDVGEPNNVIEAQRLQRTLFGALLKLYGTNFHQHRDWVVHGSPV